MRRSWALVGLVLAAAACGDGGGSSASGVGGGGPTTGGPATGGYGGDDAVPIDTLALGPAAAVPLATLRANLDALAGLTSEGLTERFPAVPAGALDYDPTEAEFLDRIQASALALNDAELAKLGENGFVISARLGFPHFTQGYADIYAEDLPVYVSVDSVLSAVHRSYDKILRDLEYRSLQPALLALLVSVRERLGAAELEPDVAHDLGRYFAVAHGLLDPSAPGLDAEAEELVAAARAASGIATVDLFGTPRDEDFSQFKPRGHYTGALEDYFRAMMWLGRVDFRFLETKNDGSRVFQRRQFAAAATIPSLLDEAARERWNALDRAVTAFVGEADYLSLPGLEALLADLGIAGPADVASKTDAEVQAAIAAGGYGEQRIASRLIRVGPATETLPLDASFAFLGQRYTVDSHVFSNVVYDRVKAGRMMPSPLDVAFAALGNDQAGALLAPEVARYEYAAELAGARTLVDAHERAYWESSLYTLWLGALRQLSPRSAEPAGLPAVATTEAWGRRVLGAQLGSWAELRHDTLLYAKQSYTGIPECEYPDAYVDPYPEAFAALATFGGRGAELLGDLEVAGVDVPDSVEVYFANLEQVTTTLAEMATLQRSGEPHSAAHLEFINDAVKEAPIDVVCAMIPGFDGWYTRLFYTSDSEMDASTAYEPVVADVHTQPADEEGAIVGRVLHVGTGFPRLLVVTVDTCVGPRAYAGLSAAYFEQITTDFERLTDADWAATLGSAPPDEVPWMESLVVR